MLMSVHEERANVGRSIQAENAEASSLLLFSTNLSDKELWERLQPTWMAWDRGVPLRHTLKSHAPKKKLFFFST